MLVAAENTSIEKARSVLLSVALEKRFAMRRGNLEFAVCVAVEFDGSKLEIKTGPIKGTSSVATIFVATELAANPSRDAIKTVSKSIIPIVSRRVDGRVALLTVL